MRDFAPAYDRCGSRPVIRRCPRNVRFGPLCGLKSDMSRGPRSATSGLMRCSKKHLLFDHLVGGREQLVRHGEAKHAGGLVVDHKLEFRRLLYRKFARFCAS